MTNHYCVYEFIFPNGKRYYGRTVNIKSRWGCKGNNYSNQFVGQAIQKYGWENIQKNIIASNLTYENAAIIEHGLIKGFQTDIPSLGYNVNK